MQESTTLDMQDFAIETISNSYIVGILSYSMSAERKKLVINTVYGFVLIPNYTSFKRFQKRDSPFFIENRQQTDNIGVSLSAVLDSREQIAIVPQTGSKFFNERHVYIYDYQLSTILYKNDFFQPIKQIAFTESDLIVASQKRVVIYGYAADQLNKNQKYYIDQYKSSEENCNIRYLETHCEAQGNQLCRCGQFVISAEMPYKLIFLKIGSVNKIRHKCLMIYNWKIDKQHQFQVVPDEQPFVFTLSADGKYLCYSQNYGRQAKIYSLDNNSLKCHLWLSRTISPIVNHGFFYAHEKLWYTSVRAKENGSATMHFFDASKNNAIDTQESKYKRYVSLFERTFSDYGIADKLIGPDFYVQNDIFYSFSLCGIIHDVIDFKRTGHHQKKKVENSTQWSQIQTKKQ